MLVHIFVIPVTLGYHPLPLTSNPRLRVLVMHEESKEEEEESVAVQKEDKKD